MIIRFSFVEIIGDFNKEVWGSGCGLVGGVKLWLFRNSNSDLKVESFKRIREIDLWLVCDFFSDG